MSMQSPSPRRWPAFLLLLMTTLGIPSAAAWKFSEQVTRHPWLALALAAAYEVVVFGVGLTQEVGRELIGRRKARLIDAIDGWLPALIAGPRFRRRYLRHIIQRHRNF